MARFIQSVTIHWENIDEDSYLYEIEALKGVHSFDFKKPVTFFVGENGSGKSTLLEALAICSGFHPEGGTKNYSFSTYNSHSDLHEALRLSRGIKKEEWGYFLRAESFYNVATQEMEYSDGAHPSQHLHERSHGESFLQIIQNQFKPNGLYLLDEPEAALSPQRQLTLLYEIHRLVSLGAQFIIVSHSPILLGMPDAEIFSFDGGSLHRCGYEDTDSYKITKLFIENREQLLYNLFKD